MNPFKVLGTGLLDGLKGINDVLNAPRVIRTVEAAHKIKQQELQQEEAQAQAAQRPWDQAMKTAQFGVQMRRAGMDPPPGLLGQLEGTPLEGADFSGVMSEADLIGERGKFRGGQQQMYPLSQETADRLHAETGIRLAPGDTPVSLLKSIFTEYGKGKDRVLRKELEGMEDATRRAGQAAATARAGMPKGTHVKSFDPATGALTSVIGIPGGAGVHALPPNTYDHTKDLTQGERTAITKPANTLSDFRELGALLTKHKGEGMGPLMGRLNQFGVNKLGGSLQSQESVQAISEISRVFAAKLFSQAGMAVTETEKALSQISLPGPNDTLETALTKIKGIDRELSRVLSRQLALTSPQKLYRLAASGDDLIAPIAQSILTAQAQRQGARPTPPPPGAPPPTPGAETTLQLAQRLAREERARRAAAAQSR